MPEKSKGQGARGEGQLSLEAGTQHPRQYTLKVLGHETHPPRDIGSCHVQMLGRIRFAASGVCEREIDGSAEGASAAAVHARASFHIKLCILDHKGSTGAVQTPNLLCVPGSFRFGEWGPFNTHLTIAISSCITILPILPDFLAPAGPPPRPLPPLPPPRLLCIDSPAASEWPSGLLLPGVHVVAAFPPATAARNPRDADPWNASDPRGSASATQSTARPNTLLSRSAPMDPATRMFSSKPLFRKFFSLFFF